jgi:transcriptional regulator ATRX
VCAPFQVNCKQCNSIEGVIPTVGFCATCLQDMIAKAPKNEAEKQTQHGDDSSWQLRGLSGTKEIRKVQVEPKLKEVLKPYQVEGVEFLWRNAFADFNHSEMGDQSKIGGCILAHYMGLGKSLTTITLIHTALTCQSTFSIGNKRPLLHTVLLIAPANTLTNWVNEVEKWTKSLREPLKILNLGEIMPSTRAKNIKKWKREGGVLVMGDALFLNMADVIVDAAQPDVLVLDEAHTMLKSSANKGFKKLQEIQTKRRILLTGTPLQNNVTEYYRMVEFIRPGVVGVSSEAEFEATYR